MDEYSEISTRLGERFRDDVDNTIETIKAAPEAAGHYLDLGRGASVIRFLRRRNLRAFPFFVLYGVASDALIFGSVVPGRSDPLLWLARYPGYRPETH